MTAMIKKRGVEYGVKLLILGVMVNAVLNSTGAHILWFK